MLKIVVTAPYVMLKVRDLVTGGVSVREFYKGAILPDESNPDDVKRLLGKGMLGEQEFADPEPPAEPKTELAKVPIPASNANKPEWVAYAVSQRADGVSEEDARAEAEAMKKDDLVAKYGNGS